MSQSKESRQEMLNNDERQKEKKKSTKKKRTEKEMQLLLRRIFIILGAVLLFVAVPCFLLATDYGRLINNQDSYTEMQSVSFGSYPQSMVSDKKTLDALSELELEWNYFDDCFSGDDYYGTMERTDCMKYADVEYNGSRYRAVVIDKYRPDCVLSSATAEQSRQDDNGFELNNVYWFLYEPIRWTIVNSAEGFMLSQSVLDAMPFNNSVYWVDRDLDKTVFNDKELSSTKYLFTPANLYKTSSVRKWLNNEFFNFAFNSEEKKDIKDTWHLTNESSEYTKYGLMGMNHDKVFLPSWKDITRLTQDKLDTLARFVPVTDYARCRGVDAVLRDGNYYTWYWLSTPGDGCGDVIFAYISEEIVNFDRQFFYAYSVGGIRCAACLNQSALEQLSVGGAAQ